MGFIGGFVAFVLLFPHFPGVSFFRGYKAMSIVDVCAPAWIAMMFVFPGLQSDLYLFECNNTCHRGRIRTWCVVVEFNTGGNHSESCFAVLPRAIYVDISFLGLPAAGPITFGLVGGTNQSNKAMFNRRRHAFDGAPGIVLGFLEYQYMFIPSAVFCNDH